MSRIASPQSVTAARIRPVTGVDAEPARLRAADDGAMAWRAWRVTGQGGALVLHDAERGASLQLEALVDGHPAPPVVELATPTWSQVRAEAGGSVGFVIAKRGPRDAVIRVHVRGPASGTATVDVTVTLRADHVEGTPGTPRAPGAAGAPATPGASGAPGPRIPWETTGAPAGATVVRLDLCESRSWWLVDAHGARLGSGGPAAPVLHHRLRLGPGDVEVLALRLSETDVPGQPTGLDADATLATRARESDAWLAALTSADGRVPETSLVPRLAGELLTDEPRSPFGASLAAVALATLDPARARQTLLGSLDPWAHDVEAPVEEPRTPPVEAWATVAVHDLLLRQTGQEDPTFLEDACSRLLTATSWWVDRLDPDGRNALHGGLLSLDGPRVLPRGVADHDPDLAHADGTAWLAVHSVAMLGLSARIAHVDPSYEDMAVTFLDTVVTMIDALDSVGGGLGMWDPEHGAYLDVARAADGTYQRIPLRSLVGLVPLLGVTVIPGETLERLPLLAERVDGTLADRPELSGSIIRGRRRQRERGDTLVSIVDRSRLGWALEHVLDPEGFLSAWGIRTLSRWHALRPVHLDLGGEVADVRYRPAGARDTDGAPLWQGQVSIALTCLLAAALRAHGGVRGSPLLLQYPTGSGRLATADAVADDLVARALGALHRLAEAAEPGFVGVDAIDAEAGRPARPLGAAGRSSLPLAFLGLTPPVAAKRPAGAGKGSRHSGR